MGNNNIKDENGLMPCPFCGGKAEWYNCNEGIQIYCDDCAASTANRYHLSEVIDLWNTRKLTT